jgi:hypothetical protein
MSGYPVLPPQSAPTQGGEAAPVETPKDVLLERVGIGLGVLMFVWGFFPWYGLSATSVNGYGFGSPAPVVVGLALLSAGVAGARAFDRKAASPLVPLAATAAALLVSFGLIIGRGDNVDIHVGLILGLVTTLLQAVAFALAWLHEIGRLGVTSRAAHWAGNAPYSYPTSSGTSYPPAAAQPAPTGYVGQSGYTQSGYRTTPSYGAVPAPQGSATPYSYPPAGTTSTYPPAPTGYSSPYGQAAAGSTYAAPQSSAASSAPEGSRPMPPAPAPPARPTSFGQHSRREPDDIDGAS